MDTTYRVLWFEDTDEAFDTLSRRLKKYITGKNLIPVIDRAEDLTPYIISEHNEISNYDLLLIDLENANGLKIPNKVKNINLRNVKSIESVEFPEEIDGSLDLGSLVELKNVGLPKKINGDLFLNGLKVVSLNSLVKSIIISGFLKSGLSVPYLSIDSLYGILTNGFVETSLSLNFLKTSVNISSPKA